MGRPLRFALIAVGVLVLLLVLLPFLIPLSVYKDRVEAELSAAIGRPVRIEGPMKLTILPDLGIRAEQVVVANVPGGQAPYLAQADDIRIAASFRALFAGRIEVSQVVVDHPDFRFEVDAAGHPNWNIAPVQARPSGLLDRMKTSVAEVKLAGGTARYEDARSNIREDVQNLDATLDWFGPILALEGELTDGGERIAFVAKASDPTALVNTRNSHVDLSLTSDLLQASFKGALTLNGPASGALKFDTPSLRKLAAWRGRGLPNVGGLGPLSIQARLDRSNAGYTLSNLKLALDDAAISGTLSVDTTQPTSLLKGALAIDRFDVDPYILPPGAKPSTRADAWDSAPFDLTLLNLFDADLTLDIGTLNIRSLTLQHAKLPITLKAGVLDTRFDQLALYGGNGTMDLHVDASQPTPAFHSRLNIHHFAAKQLLASMLGVTGIEGTGVLNLDSNARGSSVAAVMKNLWGRGDFAIDGGAIKGADLELAGRASHLGASDAALAKTASMSFSTLRGSFTLARGELHNEDFGLSNPIVEMLGGGTIDLGARKLDFTFRPRARLEHDDRPMNTISDFSAPFRLSGNWNALHYSAGAVPTGTP
ncbi:MAG TPA: AsmA family protein [Rhizomicrobium sp.]|jgi:AsmA protein